MEYLLIFISAIFVNNIVLSQFLGICPFLGVSKKVETAKGMGLAARSNSAAARAVWDEADAVTREKLGFSVLAIVRDNPTEVTVNGRRFHHPEGVLNLTQFTQVSMATLGLAQAAELREAEVLDEDAYFAGHSVGEYNALAAFAGVLDAAGWSVPWDTSRTVSP